MQLPVNWGAIFQWIIRIEKTTRYMSVTNILSDSAKHVGAYQRLEASSASRNRPGMRAATESSTMPATPKTAAPRNNAG